MRRLRRRSNGQVLSLDPGLQLGRGGEATVYALQDAPDLAAKVYHLPSQKRARKLEIMVANPPEPVSFQQMPPAVAWVNDLLLDEAGGVVGMLMPRLENAKPLIDYFHPATRIKQAPNVHYGDLLLLARNLSAAVRSLHARGYVIGDVNESNILVSGRAFLTLIDTDSFQVYDSLLKRTYRCPVGKPEYTPPELQGKRFADVNREQCHDLFGLGVLIFQLLMLGIHPFDGVYTGKDEPPNREVRILQGHFPHGLSKTAYLSVPSAPPIASLPPDVQIQFLRCFDMGHRYPTARPSAGEWEKILDSAYAGLITCANNSQHRYSDHCELCPWCEQIARVGIRDLFPPYKHTK